MVLDVLLPCVFDVEELLLGDALFFFDELLDLLVVPLLPSVEPVADLVSVPVSEPEPPTNKSSEVVFWEFFAIKFF